MCVYIYCSLTYDRDLYWLAPVYEPKVQIDYWQQVAKFVYWLALSASFDTNKFVEPQNKLTGIAKYFNQWCFHYKYNYNI